MLGNGDSMSAGRAVGFKDGIKLGGIEGNTLGDDDGLVLGLSLGTTDG